MSVMSAEAKTSTITRSNIVERVKQWARERPQAPAIDDGTTVLTYADLDQRSAEVASHLQSMGVTGRMVVGVFAERSIALIVSALGIMKAGGAYLPLDPSYPAERLTFQVADAGAEIVLAVQGAGGMHVPELTKRIVLCSADGKLQGERNPERISTCLRLDDLAYVIYTSGSTGRPKGVEIAHSNLLNMIDWYVSAIGVSEIDRVSHVAAVGFDATVWEIWPCLSAGACLCIADNMSVKDPNELQAWLTRQAITVSFVPTPMAEKLITLDWPTYSALRVMMTGGDTLHAHPPAGLPFKLVNNYGPTECTVCATSTVLPAGNQSERLPPIGRPIANTQIYIVDESMKQVPAGSEGEILIGGRSVGKGYRNRPDLTAEKFIANVFEPSLGPRLYRTGDRGCYLPDGQIAFKGRLDDQIKIRGVRMEPGEIEAALNEYPAIQESAVAAREFAPGDKRLVAYIVSQERVLSSELRGSLAKRLPSQMIPSFFVKLDRLPLNSSGKVDRLTLPSPSKANTLPRGTGGAPRDHLETQLQEIWEHVFQIQSIGIKDDFFELGGHSLLAAQLIAKVNEALGTHVPLSSLLEVRTIEDLANAIRAQRHADEWSSVVAVQPKGSRPPLFCVHSHTGDVLYCGYISEGAGLDQPIYGFQAQGVVGKPAHQSIEDMAAYYVNELQKVQCHGPYHLFGFCFGGMVAFEMARRLAEHGEKVAFLGVYNSPAPGTLKGWPLGQLTYLRRRTADEWRKLRSMHVRSKVQHILRNVRNFGRLVHRTISIEGAETWAKIRGNGHAVEALSLEAINIAAAKRFNPNYIFPGRITLFLAPDMAHVYPIAPAEGWKAFSSQGIDVIPVPLDRHGWRGTPFVETVGGRIREILRTAN